MANRETERVFELSRREFLVTTGGALAGMAAFGLVEPAADKKLRGYQPGKMGALAYQGGGLRTASIEA